jgi:hypothetical protein
MSRIEIITITNGRNKSEKDMIKFFVRESGAIKNLISFMVEYIFKPKYRMKRFESCMKWSMPGLSALIGVFL